MTIDAIDHEQSPGCGFPGLAGDFCRGKSLVWDAFELLRQTLTNLVILSCKQPYQVRHPLLPSHKEKKQDSLRHYWWARVGKLLAHREISCCKGPIHPTVLQGSGLGVKQGGRGCDLQ